MLDIAPSKVDNYLASFDGQSDSSIVIRDAVQALKQDKVVKIAHVELTHTERLLGAICRQFSLQESLAMQASFASIRGHREKNSQYFMTVNKRKDYHFIPFHSEGTSKSGMQIASMHCSENTTDGGVTVLSKVKQDPALWATQKEYCIKVDLAGFVPNRQQIEYVKGMFNIDLAQDKLMPDDIILSEVDLAAMGVTAQSGLNIKAYNVLSSLHPTYSKVLNKNVYSYWDSVASYDKASGEAYYQLLAQLQLLKTPLGGGLSDVDNAATRRVWDSKFDCLSLFDTHLDLKLAPNECAIFNNMTWTHSSTNWTPLSGQRNVYAAFA